MQIHVPTQVHFGVGEAQNVAQALALPEGASVVLVRGHSSGTSSQVLDGLNNAGLVVHQVSVSGEPTRASINAAYDALGSVTPSGIVACGGGSVLDGAKALRLCLEVGGALPEQLDQIGHDALNAVPSCPLIAVPTTAGTGAEVTRNAVLGSATSKSSIRGRNLSPDIAIVDPSLLVAAPVHVTVGAGLDAVTQTIEAYTSRFATPFTDALTVPNLVTGLQALKNAVGQGDVDYFAQLAWVSLSSGLALSNGGLGAAHGLAAVLGARLEAPHGLLCGRLIWPVLLQNRAGASPGSATAHKIDRCIDAISETFPANADDAEPTGFEQWLAQHNVPRLRDYGADPKDFDSIANAAEKASSSTKNAVILEQQDFVEILTATY